jgi:peptide deformylase
MSILKVAQLGHPIIRSKTEPLTADEIRLPATQRLIDNMIETMREYDGVGLAATQIHIAKQIAVIEVTNNLRYPEMPEVPLTVLINPRISRRSKKLVEGWEGCLSIPEMRGMVPRNDLVTCEALDRDGKSMKFDAIGFFSIVIQHEWDHLQGNVYLDRMPHLKTLTHLSEFSKYWAKGEEGDG